MSFTTSLTRLAIFLLCFSAVFAQVERVDREARVVDRKETNAQRFARGLPPARPNKLYDATRTGPALARRSVAPLYGAIIAYTLADPLTPLCYFGGDLSCDPSPLNVWSYSATVGAGSPNPQNIIGNILSAGAGLPFSLLGNPGTSQGPTITDSDLVLGTFISYTPQPVGGPPTFDPPTSGFYETGVWTVASDGTLSATWTNVLADPQGPTSGPLIFFKRPVADNIEASADPAYIAGITGATVVTLKLQPPA